MENRQEHSEELTELQEAVEMATLDKEMAEERVHYIYHWTSSVELNKFFFSFVNL